LPDGGEAGGEGAVGEEGGVDAEVAFALGNEERSEAAGVRGLEIDGGR
jgi:hypothetical protein